MSKYQDRLSSPLDSVYLGGGTPSLLQPDELNSVIEHIKQYATIDKNTEITLELDPGTFDKCKLNAINDVFTRFSMGI